MTDPHEPPRGRRLSVSEWRWTVEAACLLPPVVATLRLLGLQRTMTLLDRLASITGRQRRSMPSSRDAEFEKAALIARGVDVAARYGLVRPACLGRSLGLWWLLRRQGLPAELRIGVRRVADDLAAHAWVEHDGQVLIDTAATVAQFVSLSGDGSPSAP
ncbi:MAG: lasso peptide biosynthesis B2 protein [Anaerolineae bacterium]|nr:lasso peptide biosynthesis B2 protein [Ardenticatenia bacterium]HQZ69993.1 lasso peptide biosynthesis B2 protein [Anaerolineae bacterium]HRA21061.1 lasso peptide biosynthesis B2 protein [Anaerolineae bacterium]